MLLIEAEEQPLLDNDGDSVFVVVTVGDADVELLIEAEEQSLFDNDRDSVGEPVVQLLVVPETDGDELTVVN